MKNSSGHALSTPSWIGSGSEAHLHFTWNQLNPQLFRENFAQDVSPAEAEIMAIAQKPFNQSEIFEKSGPPAWTQLPTWYQVSSNDRMLSPDTERMFAKRMNATTISLPASHASYVSHPNEIAQLILNATKGIRK
jgi:pimeloyl-ACP methyl ester carboxylesterase